MTQKKDTGAENAADTNAETPVTEPHFEMRGRFSTATARGPAVPQSQEEAECAKCARMDMGAL